MLLTSIRAGLVLAFVTSVQAETLVNFDDVAPGIYGYPQYESAGVYIETGDMPDNVVVGSSFSQTNRDVRFLVSAGEGGLGYYSAPNFAAAVGGGTKDVFFSFPTKITSLSLRLDTAPETPGDIVRLIALKELGPGTFEVMAFDASLDNEPGAPLSVSIGAPFQWAVLQTTAEAEGFDDLAFSQVRLGDFNYDSRLDGVDIDLLFAAQSGSVPPANPLFDLNDDGVVNRSPNTLGSDVDLWVRTLANSEYGDADLDGRVDFSDLLVLAQNYNSPVSGWAQGNFDGGSGVGFADLLILAQAYGFGTPGLESSNFAADWAAAQQLVPEPGLGIIGTVLLVRLRLSRRRSVLRNSGMIKADEIRAD